MDFTSTVAGGWTEGASIVDSILGAAQPQGTRTWEIIGYSVTAKLVLFPTGAAGANATPFYGKLGKILTGVSQVAQQTVGNVNLVGLTLPFTIPGQPLPTDSASFPALWDPANDQLPPLLTSPPSANPNCLEVAASQVFTVPILLAGGQQVTIGMWMLPSLISPGIIGAGSPQPSLVPMVFEAAYQLIYDDGL